MKLDLLPGIALMMLVAAAARIVSQILPSALSEVFVALALGLVMANLIGSSEVFKKYAASASSGSKLILQMGIVALGARLSFSAVVDVAGVFGQAEGGAAPEIGLVELTFCWVVFFASWRSTFGKWGVRFR